jgi:two-component system, OmpR family, sensor histidine kinase VicK
MADELKENKQPLVLIVDDTIKNLQLLGNLLKESSYKISAATNGKQAIEIAKQIQPDLILLDVMMPELDGFETCKILKSMPETKNIPVIFLTAKVEAEDIINGFEEGAVDYITKPFNSYELKARVQTHLELKMSKDLLNERLLQLKKERNKLNTVLTGISDGVIVINNSSDIILFNPMASFLSGYLSKEAMDKKYTEILQFIPEEGPKDSKVDFIKNAIKSQKTQDINITQLLITKNKGKTPVKGSAAPLKNDEGNVTGCVVVLRDISKEREIDKMKGEFVSIASHQLKTPLTGIKWMTELLMKQNLNSDQMEFARGAHQSADRMVKLINELLDVSHIDTGRKFDLKKEKVDIIQLLESILQDLSDSAQRKNVELLLDKKNPAEIIVDVDKSKIRQVFANFIDNSIKYSKEKGKVTVGCSRENNEAIISIKDNGIGIPGKQQEKLFEKFFRADNAVLSETDGTGLGLYIAKAIVEAHNGSVWFDSVENKGTTFYIKLLI